MAVLSTELGAFQPFNLLVALTAAYIFYSIITRLYTSHLRKQLAAKLGCQPAFNSTPGILAAIKNSYECLLVFKEIRYNEWMEAKFTSTGLKTVQQTVFGHVSISTCDAENIKHVLSTRFEDFALGRRNDHMVPLLGHGIFSTDGEVWKYSRSVVRPHFSKKDIEDFRSIERHFRNLVKHIDARPGLVVDNFQSLFYKMTLDSSTEFLTGTSSNTLAQLPVDGVETKNIFMEAFDKAQELIVYSMATDLESIIFKLPAWKRARDDVFKFVDEKIQQALAENPEGLEKRADAKPREFTILHHLISDTRDPVFLRDQILSLMLAGRDTTACLLSFATYELARHPELYAKLRREIITQLGSDESRFTFSSLKDCSYLQYVLNETLRLYPPVPDNMRYAVEDTYIPRGGGPDQMSPVFLQKGQPVNYNVYAMQRDPRIWGPNAAKFIPERWEKGHPEYRKTGAWEYLPFNGGPRICIGQQYALANGGYVLARLCQLYERMDTLDPERKDPLMNSSLVMSLYNPAPIKLVRA
ncbi:CYP52A18 [Ascobolus immersus RN42]|uniref:CYP52A18 n=1 Tax=Ascobolus immersus RN42 TaxID=1160509 RepID=A0A3N4I3V5_ASCIM|nr:CYP52A18 [Ascobolus immersus RN42]